MQLTVPDLAEVVESVIDAMLGVDLGPAITFDGQAPPADMSASVQITGAWDGAVVVSCDASTAQVVASQMFGGMAGAMDEGEVADAIGELANMIGGNVKSLTGADTALSLPTVVQGGALSVAVPGAAPCSAVAYGRDGARLDVTVYARESEEDAP